MSGFHLLPPSWTSGATVTANSTHSSLVGASNLLFTQRSRKWRSSALGTLQITLNAGSAKSWDTVALLGHNGFSGTIQVFANTSSSTNLFTAANYTGSVKPLRFPGDLSSFQEYDTWLYEGAIRSHQYIGLQIIDASNPAGYFQAGVVMVGVKFMPGLGPDLGARSGRDDTSQPNRLLNGEAVIRAKRGNNVGTFLFPKQSPTEVVRWREIIKIYGSKIPMVFKWDPYPSNLQAEQHTFWYGMAQWRGGGALTFSNGHGLHDVEMSIEEL